MRNPLSTTRWSIRRKLNAAAVVPALVVAVVMVCIHFVSTGWLSERLEDASRSLQDRVHDEAAAAVEAQATRAVCVRAEGVAGQIRVYLRAHPNRTLEELQADPNFRELAIQPVGERGYTCLAISSPDRLWLHKYAKFEGMGLDEMARNNPRLSRTLRGALMGEHNTLRYAWRDPDGTTRRKLLHVLPVGVRGPGGSRVALAATVYADEFRRSEEQIDRIVAAHSDRTARTLQETRWWSGWLAVACGAVAAILAFWVAVGTTRRMGTRIDDLVGVAEDVAAGKLPPPLEGSPCDELGRLEHSLHDMADVLRERQRRLEEMNRELEDRVDRRTEQLQRVNRRLGQTLREKQDTAAELQQQLRFASALLDTIPSPLFYKDADGVYRDCNRAFAEEIIGRPREEIVGKTLFELSTSIPAELAREYHQRDLDLLASGGRQSYEGLVKTVGGELRHHLFHKAVFTNSDGEAVGLIGLMLDIHDRTQAEQEVLNHRERLRILLESIQDGVITVSDDGTIRSLNPAAERVLGCDASEVVGRSAVEVLRIRDENSGKSIEDPVGWALHTSQADRDLLTDLVMTAADGADRPVSVTASMIGEDGIVLTLRDETELRTHRREKRRLLVDLRERIKELNCLVKLSQIVEQPDITLEGILGEAAAILPAAYQYPEQAGAEIVLEGTRYATGECPPDCPVQSADLRLAGQPIGWVRVFYDEPIPAEEEVFLPSERVLLDAFAERLGRIVQRSRYERELVEIRAAVDGAADGIMLLDGEGEVHYTNEAFCTLFECTMTKEGCEAPQCLFVYDSDLTEVNTAIEQGVPWREELALQTCGGKTFSGHMRVTPVLDGKRRVGTLIAVADVSRQRQLEEQVRNAQRLSAVGQLAAGIAHEINTPTQFVGDNLRFLQEDLTALLARLVELRGQVGQVPEIPDQANIAQSDTLALVQRVLGDMDLDYLEKEVPDALSQSLEGVDRIASIVAAMKDFSHSPGPGQWSQADVGRMIRSTVTLARNEWKYCAEVEIDVPENLPTVPCLANDISQVFLNLLTNAAQAIDESRRDGDEKGRISISARRDDPHIEILVSDSGCGIPREIHSKVFDPFFTTKDVGAGTGQGLSLAHATVVEGHGGSIGFTSEPGEGTTFIVRLPLERPEMPDDATFVRPPARGGVS
jgi:PAS domain S-box-containing protein